MKILLVGEYSRLHNSLQEGLRDLGHEVTLISTGDYFKNYPADIKLVRKFESGFKKKIKIGLYRLFKFDITSFQLTKDFFKVGAKLKGHDVVQLINESSLNASASDEIKMVSFLKKHNKKLFLLCCGTDYTSVSHALSDANPYSILSHYKNGSVDKHAFRFILSYVSARHKKLHDFVYQQIDGVIASDMDYQLALIDQPKFKGLIPNPVNLTSLKFKPLEVEKKIVIFMGINRASYHTKGINYFEEAIVIIQQKFPEKIIINIVENLPYAEYIKKYDEAHILLDQVLAYDQGYNALEAMAKGKVVFTGAEKEFLNHYNLKKTVAINALPDAQRIAKELETLILNPQKLVEIGKNAREFVEEFHDNKKVAEEYLRVWKA